MSKPLPVFKPSEPKIQSSTVQIVQTTTKQQTEFKGVFTNFNKNSVTEKITLELQNNFKNIPLATSQTEAVLLYVNTGNTHVLKPEQKPKALKGFKYNPETNEYYNPNNLRQLWRFDAAKNQWLYMHPLTGQMTVLDNLLKNPYAANIYPSNMSSSPTVKPNGIVFYPKWGNYHVTDDGQGNRYYTNADNPKSGELWRYSNGKWFYKDLKNGEFKPWKGDDPYRETGTNHPQVQINYQSIQISMQTQRPEVSNRENFLFDSQTLLFQNNNFQDESLRLLFISYYGRRKPRRNRQSASLIYLLKQPGQPVLQDTSVSISIQNITARLRLIDNVDQDVCRCKRKKEAKAMKRLLSRTVNI